MPNAPWFGCMPLPCIACGQVAALDDEEQARQREEKMKRASQPKYLWSNFPNIRSSDDFAKGVLLNKKKVKQLQLKWQKDVMTRSLYDFQVNRVCPI
jgi:hypothetical protein